MGELGGVAYPPSRCGACTFQGGCGMLQAGSLWRPCLQCAGIRIHCKKGVLLLACSLLSCSVGLLVLGWVGIRPVHAPNTTWLPPACLLYSLLPLCVFQAFALLQTNFYSPSLPPYSMMASLQWPWSGQGCSILGLLRHAAVFHVTCETSSAEGGRGMLQAGSLRGLCLQCAGIRIYCKKKLCCCLRACLLPCSVEPYAPPRAPHRCRCQFAREMQESFGFCPHFGLLYHSLSPLLLLCSSLNVRAQVGPGHHADPTSAWQAVACAAASPPVDVCFAQPCGGCHGQTVPVYAAKHSRSHSWVFSDPHDDET